MSKPLPTTADDVVRDARRLYQAHKKTATRPTKADNLDRLWTALEAIRDEGGHDYSLAEVGRRLEKLGGLKTQSLRNVQGAAFREVINAYAAAVSGSTRYVAKTKSSVEQALALITDPSIKATLRVALDDAKRLKVVNDNLHAAFKALELGSSLPVAPPSQAGSGELLPPPSAPALSPRLLKALQKGIDNARLAQQGLSVSSDGSITDQHGDQIFPPAFVTAIQSVIESTDPPQK